ELVDALDSKSSSARSAGSIPARGTNLLFIHVRIIAWTCGSRETSPAPQSACWRDGCLSADGAVQRVDQGLNLDEFVAGPLGLAAVKGCGQHLRVHVPVLGHARTGFLQRLKSLTHSGFFQ